MGSASQRTSEPSLVRPSLRGLLACPKWERIETSSFSTDSYSPSQNPVDSTALPLRKTNIRNGVTPLSLSEVVDLQSRRQPHARGEVGLSQKPTPGVTPRIC